MRNKVIDQRRWKKMKKQNKTKLEIVISFNEQDLVSAHRISVDRASEEVCMCDQPNKGHTLYAAA